MLTYVVMGTFMEDGEHTVGNVLVTADRAKAYSANKDNYENCLCLSVETWENEQFVHDEEI